MGVLRMGKRLLMFAGAAMTVGAIGAGGIATAHGNREDFHVRLRGSQEVDAADPDGRATADLDINTKTGLICWSERFEGIATPTMSHIHGKAARGANAPVLVIFFD